MQWILNAQLALPIFRQTVTWKWKSKNSKLLSIPNWLTVVKRFNFNIFPGWLIVAYKLKARLSCWPFTKWVNEIIKKFTGVGKSIIKFFRGNWITRITVPVPFMDQEQNSLMQLIVYKQFNYEIVLYMTHILFWLSESGIDLFNEFFSSLLSCSSYEMLLYKICFIYDYDYINRDGWF